MESIRLKDFIKDLASSSPTPGGGGAAALSASISAALCAMVYNLTIGKKIYEGYDEEIKEKLKSELKVVDEVKDKLLTYIDKDAEAFLKLMSSYKLPKATDEEIEKKENVIQQCYKEALEVPLGLAKKCLNLYGFIISTATYGNPNLVSDAAVSAVTLSSAIEASIINAKINLKGVKDDDFVKSISLECEEILKKNVINKENALRLCEKSIGINIL